LKTSLFGSSELHQLCLLDNWLPVLSGTTQRWTLDSVSFRNPEASSAVRWGLMLTCRLKVSGCWVCASKGVGGRSKITLLEVFGGQEFLQIRSAPTRHNHVQHKNTVV